MKTPNRKNGRKEFSFLSPTALIIIAVVLSLIVVAALYETKQQHPAAPIVLIPQQPAVQNIPYTRAEAEQMMSALFTNMDPNKPENSYIPVFAREKLRQITLETKKGLLLLRPEESRLIFPNGDLNLVVCDYDKDTGKPIIRMNLQRLVNLALRDFQAGHGFSRLLKNNMYYGLTHERLHLDQNPEVFRHIQPPEQHIEEEMRVWEICDREIAGSFIQKGEPVDGSLLEAHLLLQSCTDGRQRCPVFRKWIEKQI